MPLTEAIAAAKSAAATVSMVAKGALIVETAIAHVVKRMHDAEEFEVAEVPVEETGGLQLVITIKKFKPTHTPAGSKPLP